MKKQSIPAQRALIRIHMATFHKNQKDLAQYYGVSEATMSSRLDETTKYGKRCIPLIWKDKAKWGSPFTTRPLAPKEKSIDWTNVVATVIFLGVVLMSILHVAGIFIPLQ